MKPVLGRGRAKAGGVTYVEVPVFLEDLSSQPLECYFQVLVRFCQRASESWIQSNHAATRPRPGSLWR